MPISGIFPRSLEFIGGYLNSWDRTGIVVAIVESSCQFKVRQQLFVNNIQCELKESSGVFVMKNGTISYFGVIDQVLVLNVVATAHNKNVSVLKW